MEGYAPARRGETEATLLPAGFEGEPIPAQRVVVRDVGFDLESMLPTGAVYVELAGWDHLLCVHRDEVVPLQFASLMEGFLSAKVPT